MWPLPEASLGVVETTHACVPGPIPMSTDVTKWMPSLKTECKKLGGKIGREQREIRGQEMKSIFDQKHI